MLSLLASILGLIPGLSNLATSLMEAAFNKEVSLYQAKAGVARDVAVAAVQAQAQTQSKWWFMAAVPALWALPFLAFDMKVVIWDKLLKLGTTDPLDPNMWYVHIAVLTGFFGHMIAERIIASK
jgi:hypothetical protein